MFSFFKKFKKKPIIREIDNNSVKIDQSYYDQQEALYKENYDLVKQNEPDFVDFLNNKPQNNIVLGLNLLNSKEIVIQTTSFENLGNIAIVGQMGSGKSVFSKFIIKNLLINQNNTVLGVTTSYIKEYDNFQQHTNYFNKKIDDQTSWDNLLTIINQEFLSREDQENLHPFFIVMENYHRFNEYINNSNTNSTIFKNILRLCNKRKMYFIFVLDSYNQNSLLFPYCKDVFFNGSNFFQYHFPQIQLNHKHSYVYLSTYGLVYCPWFKYYTRDDLLEIEYSDSINSNLKSRACQCLYTASKLESIFEKRSQLSWESTLDNDSAHFLKNICTNFYIEYLLNNEEILNYLSKDIYSIIMQNADNSKITLAKIHSLNHT